MERKQDGEALRQHAQKGACATHQVATYSENADVASLPATPGAETFYNARKQQELTETSPMRQPSPAGYQRRHGGKENVSTGEALGARRRNPAAEATAITASGKCRSGIRVTDRVAVLLMGVQQNTPGGKGPDR